MSSDQLFQIACSEVKKNNTKLNNEDLLKLYAYYKQAVTGNVSGNRPKFTNVRGKAKYDAWASLSGLSSEDAKSEYVKYVNQLEFQETLEESFEDKYALAKEMLNKELNLEEYEEIKELWKAHSIAEDKRDIDGLMATLTEDCRYEIPQIGKIYENKSGATQFYHDLLGAFPNIDFRLLQIYIGPQGVVEEAKVKATHEKDWLVIPASGQEIEFEVAIFFPWDSKVKRFKGERVYFNFDRKFYQKYDMIPPFPEIKK